MTARILPCGARALTVELSDRIGEEINAAVIALADDLAVRPIAGVEETVPTYRSLMVLYDPAIVRGKALGAALLERLGGLKADAAGHRRFRVPIVYGGAVGEDIDALAAMKGMAPDELIALHSSAEYRVYMIGFAPGFAYLGGLPERLHTPRLPVPRQRVEAGAVGIGGQQASISSVAGPSGWRFIGQTPVRLFDPVRPQPFLLAAGDRIQFRPVGAEEARDIAAHIAAGGIGMEEVAT